MGRRRALPDSARSRRWELSPSFASPPYRIGRAPQPDRDPRAPTTKGRSGAVDDELAFDERERERRTVLERLAGVPGRTPAERSDRAAVGDHEDVLVGMCPGDPLDGPDDALRELLPRLAVVPDVAGEPPGEALGIALPDLLAGQPRPRPDVDFAQRTVLGDLQSEPLRDDSRRLARPPEVAGVHRSDPIVVELRGECRRLPTSGVVERRVGVALPPSESVPFRLAVARQQDPRRRHTTRLAPWSSDWP